ncbi:flagellar export chaperone FliS [Maridesulfovibrio hydrothermalis]|uniref:Flagellar protein FliS n=1 Tax=Maridesulfovibrio hydrothermalis AM13 = DSM 14728 TaxID=1121451 RepID=L0REG8_9BACT|nr:flagellar export chaperone FliS [Maridesulfovibrio hydrothermalis]CCO25193.1 Flagellar protein FliS [Maridesulfovibrio hydrothermalis AM13 = DSM 14728]
MQKAAQAYLSTQVHTTSKGELLIMLYDAAIKFMKQAKVKIDEKDYAAKGILISKAIEVISELTASLNKEKGGELAENLSQLYIFCNTRLLQANLKMDTEKLDEVIKIIDGIASAYREIIPTVEAQAAVPMETQSVPSSGSTNVNRSFVNDPGYGLPTAQNIPAPNTMRLKKAATAYGGA